MRKDDKQRDQIRIVNILYIIDKKQNWFPIAGRLLKAFHVGKIEYVLLHLTDIAKTKIRTIAKDEICPYLYTIIRNNGIELDAEIQKKEDMFNLILLEKEMEQRGII